MHIIRMTLVTDWSYNVLVRFLVSTLSVFPGPWPILAIFHIANVFVGLVPMLFLVRSSHRDVYGVSGQHASLRKFAVIQVL